MIQQSHFWILIPRKIESRSQRDISPPTFTAAFFILNMYQHMKSKENVVIQTMEY